MASSVAECALATIVTAGAAPGWGSAVPHSLQLAMCRSIGADGFGVTTGNRNPGDPCRSGVTVHRHPGAARLDTVRVRLRWRRARSGAATRRRPRHHDWTPQRRARLDRAGGASGVGLCACRADGGQDAPTSVSLSRTGISVARGACPGLRALRITVGGSDVSIRLFAGVGSPAPRSDDARGDRRAALRIHHRRLRRLRPTVLGIRLLR